MKHRSTASDQTVERLHLFANIALGIGVLLPLMAALNGMGDAHQAGRFFGASALGALIILVILKGVLNTHPPIRMAGARLALGVVLIVLGARQIGSTQRDMQAVREAGRKMVATINDEDDAGAATAPAASENVRKVVAVMNGANALLKRQTAQSELFNQEFDKLDMSTALTPAGLTSYAAIDASRAKLVRFGALIDQRKRLMEAALSEGQTYLRNADLPEKYRAPALARTVKIGQQTLDMNAELSGAQKDFIKHMRAMLDFCETQLGKTEIQGGELMFAREGELATYRILSEAIAGTATREEEIVAKFAAHTQKLKIDAQTALESN